MEDHELIPVFDTAVDEPEDWELFPCETYGYQGEKENLIGAVFL